MRLARLLLALVLTWGLGLLAPLKAAPPVQPRVALVIANGAYANFDRLGATRTDGERIAAALTATGFSDASGSAQVQINQDLTLAQMRQKVIDLRDRLKAAGPDALGFLYFSGHGAALSSYGDLMLLPTDAHPQLSTENTELTRAMLTRLLLGSGARNVIIVLDMCRNVLDLPPPAAGDTGTMPAGTAIGEIPGSKGLRRLARQAEWAARADQGYLVAFSTSPDQVAFDNGTFSRVLAEEIRRPQQNVADALKRTSDRVVLSGLKNDKALQKPTFDYGLQGAPPCFVSCDAGSQDRFYDCANCPYMRVVPAGSGFVGSPAMEPGRGRDEPLQRPFNLPQPIAMGVYEVTIGEWAACVRDRACRAIGDWSKENPNPLIPAAGMAYEDAQAFVAWLSVQSGKPYRLPTEAEWEYAARAGSTEAFPWGPAISPGDANYDQTASYQGSPKAPYRGYPEAVNGYPANAFGLHQMAGNVWEWTQGCEDALCGAHMARGGSFESTPAELRLANRLAVSGGRKRGDLGLRVARDLSADEAVR